MIKNNLVILTIIFLLSSCSIFSPVQSDKKTYVLDSVPHPMKKKPRHISLLVTQPETSELYNTSMMAYSTYPHQIAYFAKNRWAEPPAKMLQPLIVQTLQNTRHFYVVSSSHTIGRYDYILSSQLVELQQDFLSQQYSQVHLKLRAQLISAATGQVIAAKEFSVTEIAPRNDPYGGVIAANRATEKMLKQLARFCLQKI